MPRIRALRRSFLMAVAIGLAATGAAHLPPLRAAGFIDAALYGAWTRLLAARPPAGTLAVDVASAAALTAGPLHTALAWLAALALLAALARSNPQRLSNRLLLPGAAVAGFLAWSGASFAVASIWVPIAGPALLLLATAAAEGLIVGRSRRSQAAPEHERAESARAAPSAPHASGGRKSRASGEFPPELDRYQLLEPIGRGAMGCVYLGRDPRINRIVAIKAVDLAAEFEPDEIPEASLAFQREAETAGRLSHPSIVTIFDVGESQGVAYIAMEYLKGRHLNDFASPGNLLPPAKALELMSRAAAALDYAHGENVVHRDIKPANIMYDSVSDTLKITDFGIARLIGSSRTRTGIVLGTPAFMSPEQVEGKNVNGHTDLFALGVSLYQLLTGRLPFRGASMTNLMFVIANEPHERLTVVRGDLPQWLNEIVDRALAKDPTERYRTGAEMAAALRESAAALG